MTVKTKRIKYHFLVIVLSAIFFVSMPTTLSAQFYEPITELTRVNSFQQLEDSEDLVTLAFAMMNHDLIDANEDGSITINQLLEEVEHVDGSISHAIVSNTMLLLDCDFNQIIIDRSMLSGFHLNNEGFTISNDLIAIESNVQSSMTIIDGVGSGSFYSWVVINRTYYTVHLSGVFGNPPSARVTHMVGQVGSSGSSSARPINLRCGIRFSPNWVETPPTIVTNSLQNPVGRDLRLNNPHSTQIALTFWAELWTVAEVTFSNGSVRSVTFDVTTGW